MDRTEFYFDQRDGDWHVQIEELLPRTGIFYSPHTTYRGRELEFYTRYIHAVISSDCEQCYHLDGALRAYQTKQNFIDRHTRIDLQQPGKLKRMSERHKLFKIESPQGDFSEYQELIGLFFKQNPHIFEFFEGESKETREIEQHRSHLFRYEFDNGRVDEFKR